MTDNEKIEYLENEIVGNDWFTDSQLEVIESLVCCLGGLNYKRSDEEDEIMLEALETVFEQSSGYFPEYENENDDDDWDEEDTEEGVD